jgi:hypothetical protein
MPTTTPNLGLASGMQTDDYVQPSQWNRIADALDRLDEFFQKITADGAFSGWEITDTKTVSAGEGNIDGKWCLTTEESAIAGLTNGAVNHVFGRAGSQAAPDGVPTFLANTSGTKEVGDIYLGTLTLDGAGDVTGLDNDAPGVDRNCCLIEIGSVAGSGEVGPLAPEESVTVTIDHSAERTFKAPGAIEFAVEGEGLEYHVDEHWAGGWFSVTVTNGGAEERSGTYTYERKGLV